MHTRSFAVALLTLAASARAARDGAAQTAPLALNRFDPAPAGDRMFGVPSPFAAGHPGLHVMLLGDYAHNPLVIARQSTGEVVSAVVAHQLFLHLDATLSLWNRLAINVDVPVAVFQAGDSPNLAGQSYASPSSAQFGDLRLGLRVRLFGEYHDAFQIGIGGSVWLPTGAGDSFVSDKKVRGLPQLLLGGRTDRVVWSLAAGPEHPRLAVVRRRRAGHHVAPRRGPRRAPRRRSPDRHSAPRRPPASPSATSPPATPTSRRSSARP